MVVIMTYEDRTSNSIVSGSTTLIESYGDYGIYASNQCVDKVKSGKVEFFHSPWLVDTLETGKVCPEGKFPLDFTIILGLEGSESI